MGGTASKTTSNKNAQQGSIGQLLDKEEFSLQVSFNVSSREDLQLLCVELGRSNHRMPIVVNGVNYEKNLIWIADYRTIASENYEFTNTLFGIPVNWTDANVPIGDKKIRVPNGYSQSQIVDFVDKLREEGESKNFQVSAVPSLVPNVEPKFVFITFSKQK